jgi:hypothetical protein
MLPVAVLLAVIAWAAPGCGEAAAEGYIACLDDPEAQLVVADGRRLALRPGQSGQLTLTCRRCCWITESVPGTVIWSLQPAAAGSVDRATGAFTIAPHAAVGAKVVVRAELTPPAGRQREASGEILVIDPSPQPWGGRWQEVAQVPCAGAAAGAAAAKPLLIQELELHPDGTFSVTWQPFERYQDYWGDYRVEGVDGGLRLTVSGGNHVPEELDLDGTLRLDAAGEMTFEGIFLGKRTDEAPVVCGHRFRR